MLTAAAAAVSALGVLAVAAHLARARIVRRLHGPRIEREVRALFGPQATVTRVDIDSSWRLILAGKDLHIPGGLTLDAREARIRGVTSPNSIVLESLEGTLRWRGLEAPVSYRVQEKPTAPVDGSLVARGATWRPGAPPFDFDGTVRVSKADYAVTATKIACDGATASGDLRGAGGPPLTKIHFEDVGAKLLEHLVALLGEHPLAIPAKARAAGDLEIAPDFARRLDATLATDSSRLALALRVSPAEHLDGSKVTGVLSFADANEARIFAARVRPQPVGESALDLELRGKTSDWVLAGAAKSARVTVDASAARPGLALVLAATDAVCTLEVRAASVRWSGLEATFLGGRVRASGALDAKGHASEVSVEDLRVEDLPVGLAEPLLRGLASATLSVRGEGLGTAKLEGDGAIELTDPHYAFLREASGPLQVFGLPPLPVRGTQPLRARVQLGGGRIVFKQVEGRVDGMRFEGGIELGFKGSLSGRIEASLEASYLAKSLLLAFPAVFTGQVTVPLEISGALGAPRYQADLVGTIGKLVTQNTVTGAIGGLVEGLLGDLLGGERRDGDPNKRGRPPRRGGLGGLFDALSG